eukprot:TRINITY_DN136_c0_g2_i1.p1 TRINITY_DN136_c0_g2~~TRINITY_DN136_c0_g2_i1.p1  ORF type:complete len:618 (-),score=120.74 TRINITY_DN136_c0_g2_i1:418-2271(-)
MATMAAVVLRRLKRLPRILPATAILSTNFSSSVFTHSENPLFHSHILTSKQSSTYLPSKLLWRRCISTSLPSFARPNYEDSKEDDRTILFEGCDYEHWLVTMEFPDPQPSREEKIDTFIKTLAKVVGSEEEAKKRIYALSTTTYTGFQAQISEETSEKLKGLPGVVWVLPDSYIDPVNKEYGGDKYINGVIIPDTRVYNNRPARSRPRNRPSPGAVGDQQGYSRPPSQSGVEQAYHRPPATSANQQSPSHGGVGDQQGYSRPPSQSGVEQAYHRPPATSANQQSPSHGGVGDQQGYSIPPHQSGDQRVYHRSPASPGNQQSFNRSAPSLGDHPGYERPPLSSGGQQGYARSRASMPLGNQQGYDRDQTTRGIQQGIYSRPPPPSADQQGYNMSSDPPFQQQSYTQQGHYQQHYDSPPSFEPRGSGFEYQQGYNFQSMPMEGRGPMPSYQQGYNRQLEGTGPVPHYQQAYQSSPPVDQWGQYPGYQQNYGSPPPYFTDQRGPAPPYQQGYGWSSPQINQRGPASGDYNRSPPPYVDQRLSVPSSYNQSTAPPPRNGNDQRTSDYSRSFTSTPMDTRNTVKNNDSFTFSDVTQRGKSISQIPNSQEQQNEAIPWPMEEA